MTAFCPENARYCRAFSLAVGAAGFAYTAVAVNGRPRKQLHAAAVLNHDLLKGYQYLALALIQGVPILLDVPLRRQHEAQNH